MLLLRVVITLTVNNARTKSKGEKSTLMTLRVPACTKRPTNTRRFTYEAHSASVSNQNYFQRSLQARRARVFFLSRETSTETLLSADSKLFGKIDRRA